MYGLSTISYRTVTHVLHIVNNVLSTSTDFERSPQKAWPNFRTAFSISQQGKTFIPKTLAFRSRVQQSVDLTAFAFLSAGYNYKP